MTRGRQGDAASCCASVKPSPSGRPMSTSTASGRSSADRTSASAQVPASPTTASPHDRRVLAASSRKEASSSTTSTVCVMAAILAARTADEGRASRRLDSGQRVWRAGVRRWRVPGMLKELPAVAMDPAAAGVELAARCDPLDRAPLGGSGRGARCPPRDIRVLLVGSHALGRAGLRRLLEDDAGVAVIGEAGEQSRGGRRSCRRRIPTSSCSTRAGGSLTPRRARGCWPGGSPCCCSPTARPTTGCSPRMRAGAAGVLRSGQPSRPSSPPRCARVAGGGALLPPRTPPAG